MSFNVQGPSLSASVYMLEWLNMQRSRTGSLRSFVSFAQVLQEEFLYDILLDIDQTAFEEFSIGDPHKKMDILEKYLDKEFGKRIKWGYKQSINGFHSAEQIRQFTKLVCYFSIHSKKKNDYVGRILSLSEVTQRHLMEQMQRLEKKMENITEIKQIIEEIEFLQCENDQLKMKLEQMTRVNSEMLELLKETETENKYLKAQIEGFRKEKSEVFSALQIDYITEYLSAYNKLKSQREKLQDLLEQTEQKLQHSQIAIRGLNDRIKCDSLVISNLSDQIARLKQLCYENQAIGQYFGSYSNSKMNLLSAGSNKENMSKCSTFLGKSMEIPTEWQSFPQNDQQNTEKNNIRTHNQGLMSTLQQSYKKYNQLYAEATQLKQQNKKLSKTNNMLRSILKQVQTSYQQFQYNYRMNKSQTDIVMQSARLRREYIMK